VFEWLVFCWSWYWICNFFLWFWLD
jgi:hypothetical protein